MTEDIQKKIFSKNLLFYLQQNQKTQREVALAIGVSPQTFNTWCQAIALPRMGKLQRIADYFKIEKSDLIDAHSPNTIQPVSLSSEEHAVVTGYRAADQPTKTVVKRLLNVEYKEPILNAAHDMGATEEEKQRADAIMMDDDEWK